MVASREIHLKARQQGIPRRDNFAMATVEVPEPGAVGEVVRSNDALIGLFEGSNTGNMLVTLRSHEQHGIEVGHI
jgi:NADPH-dependent curcumin reductase CurA